MGGALVTTTTSSAGQSVRDIVGDRSSSSREQEPGRDTGRTPAAWQRTGGHVGGQRQGSGGTRRRGSV